MGHAFGLDHAFSWSRDMGDFTSDARPGAYQDGADIMGLGGGVAGGPPAAFPTLLFRYAGPAISAAARLKMGWAAPEDVRAFSAPGAGTQTVTLRPLYAPTGAVTSSPRVVQVIEPARGRVYTVEYRPPTGWDAGLKDKPVIVHAMRSLYTAGQDCWRRCGLCQGLVFAGRTHCPAGGVHQGDVGHDYAVPVGSAAGGQPGWRLCDKCSGIFFTGHGNGVCPRDGEHRATGGLEYSLATSAAGAWRWCSKCQSLSHGGRAVAGPCPAGGFHDHPASGNYHVAWDGGTQRRDRWRECARCQGLYHAQIGACKGGLVHQLDGNDFALTHDLAGAPGESGWKWCKKCYTLAYNAAGQGPGWCAAGDKHDHSESGTYVLPIDAEASAAQLRWYHCSKCSAMNYRSANRSPGTCSADRGVHDDEEQQQFLFAHDTTAVPGAGFRWCNKCECLVLSSGAAAPCAKGDNHVTTAGASYVVRTEPSAPNRQDAAWRTCTTCKVLMRLSSPDGLSEQPCAVAGTTHKPGAVFYYPTMIGIREDPFWRRCKKCETLAFWDGTTAAGPCPADGEKHDHGGSSFYDPPSFAGDVTEIVANLELNQPVASDGNGITFELLSFNDAGATVRLRMG
jgi:hypothetical protein